MLDHSQTIEHCFSCVCNIFLHLATHCVREHNAIQIGTSFVTNAFIDTMMVHGNKCVSLGNSCRSYELLVIFGVNQEKLATQHTNYRALEYMDGGVETSHDNVMLLEFGMSLAGLAHKGTIVELRRVNVQRPLSGVVR